jgi:16S rRNA (uracil1498-N3)-methyltransferase
LTSNRFFLKKESRESSVVFLKGEEHHHLSRVARIKNGENIYLFDSRGADYLARVEEVGKNSTRLFILEKRLKSDEKTRITLAQALIKTKNLELILQKATELGMSEFVPVISSRSIIKIGDKSEKKLQRWRRIVLESSKQCGRSAVPTIHIPYDLSTFFRRGSEEKKIFFCRRGGQNLRDRLADLPSPASVVLLIGPEGGWTDREEQDILGHGFESISLGPLTLRSETAAIASLAMVSHFWNS